RYARNQATPRGLAGDACGEGGDGHGCHRVTTIADGCRLAIWRFVPAAEAASTAPRPYPTVLVGIRRTRYTRMSMDDLYRDYILEHYRRPHNFGVIEDADASYEGANPLCGDRITLMLGVKDGVVDRVGFTGRGCAI